MVKISLCTSVTVYIICYINFWFERELLLLEYQCCINNVIALTTAAHECSCVDECVECGDVSYVLRLYSLTNKCKVFIHF